MELKDLYKNICKKFNMIDNAYNKEYHRQYPNYKQLAYYKGEYDAYNDIKNFLETNFKEEIKDA